jgi:hypothetical protein
MDELEEMDFDGLGLSPEEVEQLGSDTTDNRVDSRGNSRLYELVPRQLFDFSFLEDATSMTTVIHCALPLSPFYNYWVGLRIHGRDISLASASFTLRCFSTLPHPQDPQEFTVASPLISLTCAQSDSVPKLKIATASNFGPYFKVDLLAQQGTVSIMDNNFYAELSAVLLARPASS